MLWFAELENTLLLPVISKMLVVLTAGQTIGQNKMVVVSNKQLRVEGGIDPSVLMKSKNTQRHTHTAFSTFPTDNEEKDITKSEQRLFFWVDIVAYKDDSGPFFATSY